MSTPCVKHCGQNARTLLDGQWVCLDCCDAELVERGNISQEPCDKCGAFMLQVGGKEYYCMGCRRRIWTFKKCVEIENGGVK